MFTIKLIATLLLWQNLSYENWIVNLQELASSVSLQELNDISPPEIQDIQAEQNRANYLSNIGKDYTRQGNFQLALRSYEQALKIYREIKDRLGEERSLHAIAVIYDIQGRDRLAYELYQQALLISNELHDLTGQRYILTGIGVMFEEQGQYYQALEAYEKAFSIIQGLNDFQAEAGLLNNLGVVYSSLGQYTQSLEAYQGALNSLEKVQTKSSDDIFRKENLQGLILSNIGYVYENLEQYTQAINYYQKALRIFQKLNNPSDEANTLSSLGFVYYLLGENESAQLSLEEAFSIFQELDDLDGQASVLDVLGTLYISQKQLTQAWSFFQKSLMISEKIEILPQQRITLSNIGDLLVQQNQPELAIIFYKRSVNITEEIRQGIQGLPIEQQQSYTNTIADTYRKLADLLLQQDRVLEAQQVLDLLKVQEIQDYLRRGVRGTEQTAEGIYLLPAEQRVFARFDTLLQQGNRLAELEAIPPENLTPEQQAEYIELDRIRRQIKGTFTEFLDLPDVKVALTQLRLNAPQALALDALDAIRQKLANSRQDAVLLYPLVLDDRLELVVLSPNLSPIHKTVPVTRVELNRAISEFLTVLRDSNSDAKPAAAKLYNWLIRPIESYLTESGANVVLYAPDRQLRYIPLAALHDGKQWFVEKFQINQLTAASLTSLDTPPHTQPRILAGAFSEGRYNISRRNGEYRYPFNGLPFTKVEVQTIARLFPNTRQLLDRAFTEDATLPFLNSYNIIHFATHAMFTTGLPEDSFIVMGDGSTIDMNDIRNLSLTNVDLMVFSACQTAVSTTGVGSELGDGVEILGFGYQVQNAGVRAAIASLWSVDDGGTEVLMSQFYQQLQQNNLSKAAALQQAQIALIRGAIEPQADTQLTPKALTHPYYWSPFILIGNGL